MIIHTTISGIPCRILLTYHAPLEGGLMDIPVPEHFEILDYIVEAQDVDGILIMTPADPVMTPADEDRIIRMAFDTLDGGRRFSYA